MDDLDGIPDVITIVHRDIDHAHPFKTGSISSRVTGVGFWPPPEEPAMPVTPGVLRTMYHDSSVMIISTKM
jgi:hypothetical protein